MPDGPSETGPQVRVRFGVFELDRRTGELRRAGSRVRLAGQPLRLLERLLECPGDLVTREELRQELWSDDTFVDFELNLNSAIKRLRAALGDSAESPRFIETLPRRGYRFLPPVERIPAPSISPRRDPGPSDVLSSPESADLLPVDAGPAGTGHRRTRFVRWLVAAATLTLIAAGLAHVAWPERPPAYRAIAVLPFVLPGADSAEDEYLAFGMSEALTTELSKLGALRVISQTSSMQYKDASRMLPRIAEELGVDLVIEGSVRREGNRIRITVQLIEAATDSHLWAESYQREIGSVLTVVDDVARAVARQIHSQVAPADAAGNRAFRPVDSAVAEAYLKGRYHLGRGTEADALRAVNYFERALALDPSHALSHSGLADYYTVTDTLSPDVAIGKSRFHAGQAIELDEALPDAHTSLAFLHFYYDWNWAEAEREFKRAIDLDPGHVRAHRWYGLFLSAMGRHAEALVLIQTALAADPIAIVNHDAAGTVRFNARQFAEVAAIGRSIHELNAFDARGYEHMAAGSFQLRQHAAALAHVEQGLVLAGSGVALELIRIFSLGRVGRIADAERALAGLEREAQQQYVSPVLLGLDHAHLGRHERALDYLEQAHAERDAYLVFLNVSPWFDPLRTHPRFQRLRNRLKFPAP
jgi:TolB-like protein/DNA-binding winged helix-turn-helix (wHTH) protein/Tfp pilus assembly protein PilF